MAASADGKRRKYKQQKALHRAPWKKQSRPRGRNRVGLARFLRYVYAVLLTELPLNGLHLVLQAQFELLQPDFL